LRLKEHQLRRNGLPGIDDGDQILAGFTVEPPAGAQLPAIKQERVF
jgi:hypothetical protein